MMSELFLQVVNMSISSGWIVLALLLLRPLLKKLPRRLTVLLWTIVGVRLICPFSVESVLSLIPSSETLDPEIMLDPTPSVSSGLPFLNNAINPVIGEALVEVGAEKSINLIHLLVPILAAIWAAGVTAMAIWAAVSYLRLKRRLDTAVLLRDDIYQSENTLSPFVFGIFKPKIYLPFNLAESAIPHVIAHEEAHIARRDHILKPLGFMLLVLHWFNPLIWIGYPVFCKDVELACDEKVIATLDREGRAGYSEALLACSVDRPRIAACPLAFGEIGVCARIKAVLSYKKPTLWIIVAAILVLAVMSVCFLTDPRNKPNDPSGVSTLFFGADDSYLGFSDIPEGYTSKDAADDGCLVIDITQKPNEYGALVTDKENTSGYEGWVAFTETASRGDDAFIRVAHFIDGVGYYHDLYYTGGKYTIFDLNEFGVSEGKSFKYLRRLDGIAGPASDPKEDCFYVLTDSLELSYDDVSWSFLSSDHTTVTKIPFEWLGFMIHFE